MSPVGPEFLVNTTVTGQQRNPAVASNAAGNFVVVWTSDDGSSLGIYARRYDASGAPLPTQTIANVPHTTDTQFAPAVAMNDAGDFVIVWTSFNGALNGLDVFVHSYYANGAPKGLPFVAHGSTTGNQAIARVAIDQAGNFVVVWSGFDTDGSGSNVYARRFNASNVPQAAEFLVSTTTTGEQNEVAVAMDYAGNFVVTWTSEGQDGSGKGVYAQRFSSAGSAQGGELLVNSYTTGNQFAPSVARGAAGDFVIVWNCDGQDGSGEGVFGQRFTSAAVAQGTEFMVNTTTTGNQSGPSVTTNGLGDFVVAWASFGQDGDDYAIIARRFTASGVSLSDELPVNTYTTDAQLSPSVAADQAGNFVVAWQSFGQDSSDDSIYARRYHIDQPATVVDRHIFYNNSWYDGDNPAANTADDSAIATDKSALRADEIVSVTATFANYTSYSRGINGIMIDVDSLANGAALSAADFSFTVGNNNSPGMWATAAPAPSSITVRTAAGEGGSDRVTIIWPDGAIAKKWLRVTVLPTAATGLTEADVFYFGNAVGDTGLGNNPGFANVSPADELYARANPKSLLNPALIDNIADFNRDRQVNPTDQLIARSNPASNLTALQLIVLSPTPPEAPAAVSAISFEPALVAVSPTDQGTAPPRPADPQTGPLLTAGSASTGVTPCSAGVVPQLAADWNRRPGDRYERPDFGRFLALEFDSELNHLLDLLAASRFLSREH